MTIDLILQSATKVITPPFKTFSLGDGYEQAFSTAIADTEIWNVTTVPLNDGEANDLEDALNALQGGTFAWTPPYGSSGNYRLNSKITRSMVGYRLSVLQFSLRKTAIVPYADPDPLPSYWGMEISGLVQDNLYGEVTISSFPVYWGNPSATHKTGPISTIGASGWWSVAGAELGDYNWECVADGWPKAIALTTYPSTIQFVSDYLSGTVNVWHVSINGGESYRFDDQFDVAERTPSGYPVTTSLEPSALYQFSDSGRTNLVKIWLKGIDYEWDSVTGAITYYSNPNLYS